MCLPCICHAFIFFLFDTFLQKVPSNPSFSIHQRAVFKTPKVVRNGFALEVVYLRFSLLGKDHLRLAGWGVCVCAWEGSVNKKVARFKLSLMEEFEQKEKTREEGKKKRNKPRCKVLTAVFSAVRLWGQVRVHKQMFKRRAHNSRPLLNGSWMRYCSRHSGRVMSASHGAETLGKLLRPARRQASRKVEESHRGTVCTFPTSFFLSSTSWMHIHTHTHSVTHT